MSPDLGWAELAKVIARKRESNFIERPEDFPGQKRIEDLEIEIFHLKEALREVIKENINLLYFFEKIGTSLKIKKGI
jgi:hypothetical protein